MVTLWVDDARLTQRVADLGIRPGQALGLSVVPACHEASFNLASPQLLQAVGPPASYASGWYWQPEVLIFTDGNGNSWEESFTPDGRPYLCFVGPSAARPGLQNVPDIARAPEVQSISAAGCS
jgi:hypothetical protein